MTPKSNELKQSIRLFPNPAKETAYLQYDLNNPSRVQIELFDIIGQKAQTIVGKSKQEKNLSEERDCRT